jgi:L-fucose mutarotase
MLKGINSLLNADVLYALRSMGHGDDLVIADTNFPSDSVARETILGEILRIDASAAEVVRAVLSVYPLDTFVDDATGRMEVVGEPKAVLPVMQEVQKEVLLAGGPKEMLPIERYAFYERAKKAYAVIQTGERRFYGCFALRKGVVGPDE